MKTKKDVERLVSALLQCGGRVPGAGRRMPGAGSSANRLPGRSEAEAGKSKIANEAAFTLIELLVVISIIGVLAALIFPLAKMVKRNAFIHNAQSQMAQLETAIGNYKSVYGFYPPDSQYGPLTNQLYYELSGTMLTNVDGILYYMTLDHSAQIRADQVSTAFGTGVGGFMNCNKPGADESAPQAQNFLPDLKPDEVGTVMDHGIAITNLVTSADGPDLTYKPLGEPYVNPWRYKSSGTLNNPGSYDLWIQLVIAGQTNLVCNWTKQVQINNAEWP